MSTDSKCIPVKDIRVASGLCCCINGCSCKWPDCWGCGVDGVLCCIQSNAVCCKIMDERKNEDQKMFICQEGGFFCKKPNTCCQMRSQFCCCDSRGALPCTEEVPCIFTCLPGCSVYPKFGCCAKVGDLVPDLKDAVYGAEMEKEMTDVPVGEVRVCEACMCSICGFMCKYPECLGVKTEGMCLCFQVEQALCKMISKENDENICCVCCDGGAYVVMPKTCIQCSETCFCIDARCALPCTDKVPCICGLFGLVCCANKECKMACFPKVEDIIESYKVQPEEAPPVQPTMVQ